MRKRKSGTLTRKLFILFSLIACLALMSGERQAPAATALLMCSEDDWRVCMEAGNYYFPQCCKCVEFSTYEALVSSCNQETEYYDFCRERCMPL